MKRFLLSLTCALVTLFASAAVTVEDYYIDYTKKAFSFFNMNYAPEYVAGQGWKFTAPTFTLVEITDATKDDPKYEGCEVVTEGEVQYYKVNGLQWYQFFAGDGVKTTAETTYTITVKIKGSKEGNINVNFGTWGNANSATLPVTTEWAEQSIEIVAPVNSCFVVFQPGASDNVYEMQYISVTHEAEMNPDLICMAVTNLAKGTQSWDQTIDYEFGPLPAGKYTLSFQVYGDVDDNNGTVLTNGGWTWEWRIPQLEVKKNQWNTITKEMNWNDETMSYEKLSFFIGTYAGTVLYLDNFVLTAEGKEDVNLLSNGDFSLVSNRGWSMPSYLKYSIGAAEGPEHLPDYTINTTVGKFGTIVFDYPATVKGAKLYNVAGWDATSGITLAEHTGNMVAGTPYFYCAEDATVKFYKAAGKSATHGDFDCTKGEVGNGLVGCYSEVSPTTSWYSFITGSYVLSGGKMRKIGKASVTIGANRCFFDPSKFKTAEGGSVRLEIDGDIATGIDAVAAPAVEGKIYELDGREATTMVKGRIYVVNGMKVQVK